VKTPLETSGKDVKTPLETSGKDVKTTLETSVQLQQKKQQIFSQITPKKVFTQIKACGRANDSLKNYTRFESRFQSSSLVSSVDFILLLWFRV
jgi:hypothetical protein